MKNSRFGKHKEYEEMTDVNPDEMRAAYNTAAAWMPENREGLLGNVTKTIFADNESKGGFAAIHDFGEERLVRFDVRSGSITEAASTA